VWDFTRRAERHRISAHQQWVASLSFSSDGKTLASTGAEPVIRLWDVNTGRDAFVQSGHRSAVSSLAVSPIDGTVFTGGCDGTVRHWDPGSGRELDIVAQLGDAVEALDVAPDGKTLLVVDAMGTDPEQGGGIRLWSVRERREIRRLEPSNERDAPRYVAYSPDGNTVASQGQIWGAVSGELLVRLRHHDPQDDRFLEFGPGISPRDAKRALPFDGPITTIAPRSLPTAVGSRVPRRAPARRHIRQPEECHRDDRSARSVADSARDRRARARGHAQGPHRP
jgi:WD40 repeat protein